MIVKHTEEFDLAYRFVTETNQNIFLTGKAGTGKTTFLKYLLNNTIKNCVVAAPTGVAAINAHGVTLHSLFQLPLGIILPQTNLFEAGSDSVKYHPLLSKIHYNREKSYLLQNLELLIIDEASMVASYTVDAIDNILRYVRRNPYQPFGGIQILFIGDLYQLPPVIKKDDWEILKDFYSSIFFFNSFVLRKNTPVIIELKEIFRQQDNKFIEILNGIRNNNITEENFKLLNSRINNSFAPSDNAGYITLTTHNAQSGEINRRKLTNLSGNIFTYHAEIKDDFPEHIFPAEKELKLKPGAQVMFLKNDTEGRQYFNGKIGVITKLDKTIIKVKCQDDPYEIEVKKSEWQNIRYKLNPETKEITEEVIGTFIQYPLRLAWAITIHKSQGLTFDKVIIDAARAFATGQVYVALSRCTSLEGMVLRTPIYKNFLGAHKDFKEWLIQNWNTNLEQLFIESRQNFIIEELQNIFSWEKWYFALKDLKLFLMENDIIASGNESIAESEAFNWITGIFEKEKELHDISKRFKQMICRLGKELLLEKNELLQQRIKDGANYFYNEIFKWREFFSNHPLSIASKKLSRNIDDMLNKINYIIEEILLKLKYCQNGFQLDNYLKAARTFYEDIPLETDIKIKSCYQKNKLNKKDTVKETVKSFHQGKNIVQIAEERSLTVGTIENHLARAIRRNLIQIEEIIQIDEVKKIAEYFPKDLSKIGLSFIKEKAPPEISYGVLRMISAWLQKEKEE